MNYPKEEALKFFSDFYYGEHHIPSPMKECGEGWQVNHYGHLSTFDYNGLTRLVLMAHKLRIRVEISPCNSSLVRIKIHKRQPDGKIYERHPSIDDAIALFQEKENPI